MAEVEMMHVSADDLLLKSFELGRKVYETGFRPRYMISLWRGGTPVGLGVDSFFRSKGLEVVHTTVATDSYTDVGERKGVNIRNLNHVIDNISSTDPLLIIDDVLESRNTVGEIVKSLRERAAANAPQQTKVATWHDKPGKVEFDLAELGVEIITLETVADHIWIDYPHELEDLVDFNDPEDLLIKQKNELLWNMLRSGQKINTDDINIRGDYRYMSAQEILMDAFTLGVNAWHERNLFYPDFIVALWPGGVCTGLPVHEVYKYFLKKNPDCGFKKPDNITINTTKFGDESHPAVIGISYLKKKVRNHHKVLLIDAVFRSGKLFSKVYGQLNKALRANIEKENLRLAVLYHNTNDFERGKSSPDVQVFEKPHYCVRQVNKEIIYPTSIRRLKFPERELVQYNPELARIVYGVAR